MQRHNQEVFLIEGLQPSWLQAQHWRWIYILTSRLLGGLIFGLIGGMLAGLIGLSEGFFRFVLKIFFNLSFGLHLVLVFTLFFGLTGAAFYGLNRETIETKTAPNEGIRLTARNAVLGGLIIWLIAGLSCGLSLGLNVGLVNRLGFALNTGLFFGLLGALWNGGLDLIQHYTLRFILVIQGHTPRNYVQFLDHAVSLIFLQKVGGGYRFIHRLLLEHFAAMEGT